MLKDIIHLFERTERPTSLSEMARTLGVQESALEGMLDTLARQGKLAEVGAGSDCATGVVRQPLWRLSLWAGTVTAKELPAGKERLIHPAGCQGRPVSPLRRSW